MRLSLLVWLGLLLVASRVVAETPSVRVLEPRAFGYFIGDVVARVVSITTDADQTIDPASIPRPGPLNYWLNLKSVELEENVRQAQGHYTMRLEYQTFYAPLEPRRLQIPAIRLRLLDGQDENSQAMIPAWSFLSSPLREIIPEASSDDRAGVLRPDLPVLRASTVNERAGMATSGIIFVVGLGLLAHHFAFWPFHRRRARPFTLAKRAVGREAAKKQGSGDYRHALLVLHRAFDEAAKHRMLAGDLETFLAERPEFVPLRSDIDRFFAQSRRAFFADDMMGTKMELPLADLAALATQLSARERAAR